MEAVKLVRVDDSHVVITGSNRDAVTRAVAELLADGYLQLEQVQPLGKNWVATCQALRLEAEVRVEGTVIGLQTVLESANRPAIEERIATAKTYGAVLVAGPEWVERRWVAVLDTRATAGAEHTR